MDFSKPGKVLFLMQEYIERVVAETPEYLLKGPCSTPAANHLFHINEKLEALPKKEETFWGIEKNRVASRFFDQRTMKETVQHLQEGWYGNHFGDGPPPDEVIKSVNCEGLVRKSIKAANDIVGIEG